MGIGLSGFLVFSLTGTTSLSHHGDAIVAGHARMPPRASEFSQEILQKKIQLIILVMLWNPSPWRSAHFTASTFAKSTRSVTLHFVQ